MPYFIHQLTAASRALPTAWRASPERPLWPSATFGAIFAIFSASPSSPEAQLGPSAGPPHDARTQPSQASMARTYRVGVRYSCEVSSASGAAAREAAALRRLHGVHDLLEAVVRPFAGRAVCDERDENDEATHIAQGCCVTLRGLAARCVACP